MTVPTSLAPVVKSVHVPLAPAAAFELFTRDMGTWWPLQTHSIAADTHEGQLQSTGLVFEPRLGGGIFEELPDGSRGQWGTVLSWDPPASVAFSWNPTLEDRPLTTVAVTFTADSGGTTVELVHSDWDRLGDRAGRQRTAYDSGWVGVLERFRAASQAQ